VENSGKKLPEEKIVVDKTKKKERSLRWKKLQNSARLEFW
jgi:hypothetical protein